MFVQRVINWVDRKLNRVAALLPERAAVNLLYLRKVGRLPNLRRPMRFTELVQIRKRDDADERLSRLTDKVLAKQYVADVLGPDWVIPTLWSGTALPPQSERNWPLPFVIKANFGSGFNHFVFDQEENNQLSLEALTEGWMRSRYRPHLKERYQDRITKCLLAEPFLGTRQHFPPDYKFYCFGGKVECIFVMSNRGVELKGTAFSPDWEKIELEVTESKQLPTPPAPGSLKEIIKAAEQLSAQFAFVRIDFYEIDGVPKFSEFTFTPNSGYRRFKPSYYDAKFGALWLEADTKLRSRSHGVRIPDERRAD